MGALGVGAVLAGGALGAAGSLAEGKSSSNYYNSLATIYGENAKLARAGGQSQINSLGTEQMAQVSALHEKERATIGAQKSALVSGAGIGSKTGEQLISDTESKINLDDMALRYNYDTKMKNINLGAETQAFNYETQALGAKMSASVAKKKGQIGAVTTILGAAGTAGMAAANPSFNWWG
jgi:hypothetical protein